MPDWTRELRRRLAGSGLDGGAEADVVEELARHLDDRFDELRAGGASEADARRLALEELEEEEGALREGVRAAAGPPRPPPLPVGAPAGDGPLGRAGADLRLALRLLRRAPVFTAVAVAVIALGIGANTAVYSVVSTVLLRPLPGVRAPEELVVIHTSDYSGPRFSLSSGPDYEEIRRAGEVFTDVAAHAPRPFSLAGAERPERVLGELASANYFDVLGVRPALGRFFLPDEAGAPGTAPVVVISHDLWRRRFGASEGAVGSALRVNGQTLTVVGVAPESFRGSLRGIPMDLWVPLAAPPAVVGFEADRRTDRGLFLAGRLRPGATPEEAQARLDVVARRLHAAYPDAWTDVSGRSRVLTVLPESEARVPRPLRGAVLGLFGLLAGVVGIVLLIACANVANLLLARASARRGEMGIRLALGASRARIASHLLTESLLLSAMGGALGLLLAAALVRAVTAARLPLPVPVSLDVALDGRVALFALALTLATGVLAGLAPALRAGRSPAPTMRGGAASRRPRERLRGALVLVQVAASLVLLVGGGLFLRSLRAAQRIDPGFRAENVVLAAFDLSLEGYSPEEAGRFYEEALRRAASLPGVTEATLAERVPLGAEWSRRGVEVEGYAPAAGEDMEVPYNGVGPGYFLAMGIDLRRGRGFTAADRDGAPPVVVVNEAFARRFWPGEDPLGKRVSVGGPMAEVVGVVPDGKYRSLTEEPTPYVYYPYLQRPSAAMTLHLRTAGDPQAVVPALRAELREVAPRLPAPAVTTLRQHLALATLPQRVAGAMLGVLGALALGIAGVGLYGVVAYGVSRRTREIGIRVAMGALAGDVRRMVLGEGLRLGAAGIGIGLALSVGLARLVRGFLLVSPLDAPTLVAVPLLLLGAVALASWLPARRATRVDPVEALRAE